MRILFIGRDNAFNRGIAKWLAQRWDLVAWFQTEPQRFSWRSRLRRLRTRARRRGWLHVLDEVAFHLFDRVIIRRPEKRYWEEQIPLAFRDNNKADVPTYVVGNLHDQRWLRVTRQLEPHLVFAVCGSIIFRPTFYTIPSFGAYILHEGITPEYRGLHTPLWALLKGESEYIGFTLLKADRSVDGGAIVVQGRSELKPGDSWRRWSLVGHRTLIEGLPKVEQALDKLGQNGTFEACPTEGRVSHLYTWVRLSEFIHYLLRTKWNPTVETGNNYENHEGSEATLGGPDNRYHDNTKCRDPV